MSPIGMTESVGDSHVQSAPIPDPSGINHPSTLLSTDGANKNQLAITDYLSSAFPSIDFQNMNLESFLPYMTSQNSPPALYSTEPNGHVGLTGQTNMYHEYPKIENPLTDSSSSMFAFYQNGRPASGATDMSLPFSVGSQFSSLNCNYSAGVSNSKSSGGSDFESLQQKISQKKQTLDFLQGVIPDPLANQEKRYMTMTERIQVPSSDHVAEIVGKNGQRIKQLREQLKVWVKTPSRDEPPIFEVTGLPEKLAEAKRIILQMSEHFTKVQQERLHRSEPNRIEDRLYVEQDKVGLIVGASGQTIRWVQQLSDTHIATPRKQESIPGLPPPQTFFTICGTPEKVKFAKQLICEYVTLRCQGLWLDPDLEPSAEASRLVRDFHQRRQVEDSQRRTTTPQAPSLGRTGRPLVGSDGGAAFAEGDTAVKQLITDVKDLWSGAPAKAAGSSDGSSGQESPRRAGQHMWGPLGIGLTVTDRRFSADGSGHSGDNGESAMKKSHSDDQVSPHAPPFRPGSGWM